MKHTSTLKIFHKHADGHSEHDENKIAAHTPRADDKGPVYR